MMSTLRFQDKVAIVTGGCQGVGRGCVDVLVENGGKVIVFDIADEIGLQMTSEGPGQIKYKHCDVTKEDEVRLEYVTRHHSVTYRERDNMNSCPDCNKGFSRRDNLLRHQRQLHDGVGETHLQEGVPPPPPPPHLHGDMPSPHAGVHSPPPPPIQEGMFPHDEAPQRKDLAVLHHPFTMMISGPTACGKTTFVKNLLQNHTAKIQPGIKRIVWLYKRWQRQYTVIQKTTVPKVEIFQGISVDLDDDDFFDTNVNNLLIIDDLFSVSGKDNRITDLFTEGSHHRSLSVILINQNLFGNKDPTQRRNCHYLVLFNNPVDRQSVMTLSRQMYPGHTDRFMKSFEKATKHPYGYLFVDLKPFTKEQDRLKYEIQWTNGASTKPALTNHVQVPLQNAIKEITQEQTNHYSVGVQTDHINEIFETEDKMAEKGQACDDCGLLFDSPHDVQRHVKRGWCPENRSEPPAKKAKMDAIESEQEDIEESFLHLWSVAQKQSVDRVNKIYEQYVRDGEDEEDAEQIADERSQTFREKRFFEKYQTLLELYWLPLITNNTHISIVEDINNLRNQGISLPSAVKRVLKKNKNKFQDLFETEDSEEESDESEDGESDSE